MFDVVIPIYKIAPELLNRCLESINNQDFFDYEVFVVDGTPLDWEHTEECRNLVAHYNFNYVRQIGTGVSQARNQGVSMGTNPYIAFLDGDDWWYSEHLYELSLLIDRCPIDNNYVMWWNPMDTIIVMEPLKINLNLINIVIILVTMPSGPLRHTVFGLCVMLFFLLLWPYPVLDF